jgi:hypothetical protein
MRLQNTSGFREVLLKINSEEKGYILPFGAKYLLKADD